MNSIRIVKTLNFGNGEIGYLSESVDDGARILVVDKTLHDKYTGNLVRKFCVSVSSGCGVGCIYCFTNNYGFHRPLRKYEIVDQVHMLIYESAGNAQEFYDEVKISFKQMGDPLLNPDETLKAISELYREFPEYNFVVSTSAPQTDSNFFERLDFVKKCGAKIRLQFSCHTTSDSERTYLCPKINMMTFSEIGEVVNQWQGGIVTLNFVMLEGFSYDVNQLKNTFDPSKVFIKTNYIDHNDQTCSNSLKDMGRKKVDEFIENLDKAGFQHAHRH